MYAVSLIYAMPHLMREAKEVKIRNFNLSLVDFELEEEGIKCAEAERPPAYPYEVSILALCGKMSVFNYRAISGNGDREPTLTVIGGNP